MPYESAQGSPGMIPIPQWSARMWEDTDQIEWDDGRNARPVWGRREAPGLMQPVHQMSNVRNPYNKKKRTFMPRGAMTVTVDHPTRDPFDSAEARWEFYRKMILPSKKDRKYIRTTKWVKDGKLPKRRSKAKLVDRLLEKK